MTVQIDLSDELASRIDDLTIDRKVFVEEAVRRMLRETSRDGNAEDLAKINDFADELNREAEDVLEYQVLS